MADAPVILQLDLRAPRHQALTPFLAPRIRAHADKHQPEVHPDEFTAAIMAALWGGDPRLVCFVAVDPGTGAVLGHALARHEQVGSAAFVNAAQAPPRTLGPTRFALLDALLAWAAQRGTPRVLVAAEARDKALEARYHARLYRHLLEIPLDAPVPAREPVAGA